MQKSEQTGLSKSLESVGLKHNPFEPLEASADRRLISRFIDNEVSSDAWKKDVCFIVGSPGSGRTTVAEKVLYDCRTGEDSSHTFPVRITGLELTSEKTIHDLAGQAAAVEMLLQLAYEPWKFEELKPNDRSTLVAALESAAPGILAHFLPQIEKSGSLIPVAEFTDLPASALPGKPETGRVREMARQIGQLSRSESRADKAPPSILDIVPGLLGFNEIKLVADFQTTPSPDRLDELDSFHDELWQAGKKTSLVTLVPLESNPGGRRYAENFMTWSKEQLAEVLRTRVKVASDGNFNGLSAISDPSMPRDVEAEIVDESWKRGRQTPRDVLSLAGRVLECRGDSKKGPPISIDTFQKAIKKEYGDAS